MSLTQHSERAPTNGKPDGLNGTVSTSKSDFIFHPLILKSLRLNVQLYICCRMNININLIVDDWLNFSAVFITVIASIVAAVAAVWGVIISRKDKSPTFRLATDRMIYGELLKTEIVVNNRSSEDLSIACVTADEGIQIALQNDRGVIPSTEDYKKRVKVGLDQTAYAHEIWRYDVYIRAEANCRLKVKDIKGNDGCNILISKK